MLRSVATSNRTRSTGRVDPALSLKRSIAGRKGAAARWGDRVANDGSDQPRHPPARAGNHSKPWYRISNAVSGGTAVIDIYGEIGWDALAAEFVSDLRDVTADRIDLHLNSPGGDVYDGIAIYNALVEHPAQVQATIDGLAASIASVIAQAGDKIVIAENAQMMIHNAWAVVMGDADELRAAAKDLERHNKNIAGIYATRSGRGDVDRWLDLMAAETWMSAEEAVKVGLADEVRTAGKRSGTIEDAVAAWPDRVAAFRWRGRESAPDLVMPPERGGSVGGLSVDAHGGVSAGGPPPDPPPPPAAPATPVAAEVEAVVVPPDLITAAFDLADPPPPEHTIDPAAVTDALQFAFDTVMPNSTHPPTTDSDSPDPIEDLRLAYLEVFNS